MTDTAGIRRPRRFSIERDGPEAFCFADEVVYPCFALSST